MTVVNFVKKHKQFTFFLLLAITVFIIAIFAPYVAPKNPYSAVMIDSLKPPSKEYLFGTDILGRDLLSRIIYGARYSIFMTLTLVAVVFCAKNSC